MGTVSVATEPRSPALTNIQSPIASTTASTRSPMSLPRSRREPRAANIYLKSPSLIVRRSFASRA